MPMMRCSSIKPIMWSGTDSLVATLHGVRLDTRVKGPWKSVSAQSARN